MNGFNIEVSTVHVYPPYSPLIKSMEGRKRDIEIERKTTTTKKSTNRGKKRAIEDWQQAHTFYLRDHTANEKCATMLTMKRCDIFNSYVFPLFFLSCSLISSLIQLRCCDNINCLHILATSGCSYE